MALQGVHFFSPSDNSLVSFSLKIAHAFTVAGMPASSAATLVTSRVQGYGFSENVSKSR